MPLERRSRARWRRTESERTEEVTDDAIAQFLRMRSADAGARSVG